MLPGNQQIHFPAQQASVVQHGMLFNIAAHSDMYLTGKQPFRKIAGILRLGHKMSCVRSAATVFLHKPSVLRSRHTQHDGRFCAFGNHLFPGDLPQLQRILTKTAVTDTGRGQHLGLILPPLIQLYAHPLFQLCQILTQRRLGNKQLLCRLRQRPFLRNGQKVYPFVVFHRYSPSFSLIIPIY